MNKIEFFRKRSGRLVKFNPQKIEDAIGRAFEEAKAVWGKPVDTIVPNFLMQKVVGLLDMDTTGVIGSPNFFVRPDSLGSRVPKLEDVQDAVEYAIRHRWEDAPQSYTSEFSELLYNLYSSYRKEREKARASLKVLNNADEKIDVTDKGMLLQENRKKTVNGWDRNRLEKDLEDLMIDNEMVSTIAKRVERAILKSGLRTVSSDLIVELVNNELTTEGIQTRMNSGRGYFVDKEFVDGLMESKSKENSNIANNNPEAINLAIAELVLKKWALDNVFSPDIVRGHQYGLIYLHDLGYITRVYCSSHSIEYLKRYGLRDLNNLNTESGPAKSASVLTGHLNTYLASMQAYYAGALGLGYINVFYAPMLVGMSDKEMYQTAQEMVFNGSQNAFSRGGQSLHPDELIWVKKDGRYRSVRIGAFADAYIDGNPSMVSRSGDYEIFKTDGEGIQAISFEKASGKVLDKPILYVARMPHKGKMYRLHTSNGVVNVTGDHSVFTFHGKGDIRPTKAKDLKRGDFVVIPHRVNFDGTQDTVDITRYIPEDWLSVKGSERVLEAIKGKGNPSKVLRSAGETRHIMKDAKGSDKVRASLAKKFVSLSESCLSLKGDSKASMPAVIRLTKDLGYVAGMFCSEGHQSHKKVIISNKDLSLLKKVEESLDRMAYPWYRHNKGMDMGMTTDQVEINGVLGAFVKMSCSDGKIKIVPDWVFTAPDECVQGFLEGFYDGEGNNRKSVPGQWSVSNTSTRVVSGIGLLLLRYGEESLIYMTRPGNPRWSDIYELRKSKSRKINPFSENTTVEGVEKYMSHVPKDKREAVEWMKGSDLSVSMIRKVEEYEYDGPVYDISVPGTEAFLGGVGNVFFKNTLFLDYNIHTGVPEHLRNVPAVGPGGKYYVKVDKTGKDWRKGNCEPLAEHVDKDGNWCLLWNTPDDEQGQCVIMREKDGEQVFYEQPWAHVLRYGDYQEETRRFAHALLDVWKDGDVHGHIFEFPKCDFHVNEDTFRIPEEHEVFMHACEVAAHNGSVYFVFDRDSVSVASCCRLRVSIDVNLFKHPERIRSVGFQNVTINIPQASYRTNIEASQGDPEIGSETWSLFIAQIDKGMDLAVKAHLQKKKHIARMMSGPGMPLWQVGMPSCDGKPYIDLDKCVYIIGLIGLDDACRYLFGKSMYEDEKLTTWGLSVIAHMNLKVKEYTEKYGITFSLEESPAESAARKLARSDLAHFPKQAKAIVHGAEDAEYYTNSIHLPAEAPVNLVERITRQAMFHGMIDSGAITHAFIGEETPSPGAIAQIVEKTFRLTQSAQITFSPEFTYCLDCGHGERGLQDECRACGSKNVVGETRVVGYFSRIQNWNKSKRFGELVARHKGQYGVETCKEAENGKETH